MQQVSPQRYHAGDVMRDDVRCTFFILAAEGKMMKQCCESSPLRHYRRVWLGIRTILGGIRLRLAITGKVVEDYIKAASCV